MKKAEENENIWKYENEELYMINEMTINDDESRLISNEGREENYEGLKYEI